MSNLDLGAPYDASVLLCTKPFLDRFNLMLQRPRRESKGGPVGNYFMGMHCVLLYYLRQGCILEHGVEY